MTDPNIITRNNAINIGTEFSDWFNKSFHSNARVKAKGIQNKFRDQNLGSAPVHQFMKWLRYNGFYYVFNPSTKKLWKRYEYKDGDFIKYSIYDSNGLLKTAVPKSYQVTGILTDDEVTQRTVKKDDLIITKPTYQAVTDYVKGLSKGMIVVKQNPTDEFYTHMNGKDTYPAFLVEDKLHLFKPLTGVIRGMFYRISGYTMCIFNDYYFGVNKDGIFGLITGKSGYDAKPLVGSTSTVGYDGPGFYYHEVGPVSEIIYVVDEQTAVYKGEKNCFPIVLGSFESSFFTGKKITFEI